MTASLDKESVSRERSRERLSESTDSISSTKGGAKNKVITDKDHVIHNPAVAESAVMFLESSTESDNQKVLLSSSESSTTSGSNSKVSSLYNNYMY